MDCMPLFWLLTCAFQHENQKHKHLAIRAELLRKQKLFKGAGKLQTNKQPQHLQRGLKPIFYFLKIITTAYIIPAK